MYVVVAVTNTNTVNTHASILFLGILNTAWYITARYMNIIIVINIKLHYKILITQRTHTQNSLIFKNAHDRI